MRCRWIPKATCRSIILWVSKPQTGDYAKDVLYSRDRRIFYSNQTEVRRVTNRSPMLLQTYMRDTGEVLNDLSMPIFIDGKHWALSSSD